MSGLILHPEKGVNPRIASCPYCGKDSGVVLLGRKDKKDTCNNCGMIHYGGADGRVCQKCKNTYCFTREEIGEHEKIAVVVCHDCEKALKEHHEDQGK